ncbi:response regulator transcription factor [Tepidibacter aestuarii]|uniref:response regulator transcription factor n=1 Tax=Tepidibacter aestuarii TaxID=2925782 RepID=UPI0020BF7BD8|nr:response regulator transcription factor [Tepidibacter aestuarii]CAH2213324.1 Regulatory protein VanR [Tepidibacter aestuarii]
MYNILVVDDEREITDAIEIYLTNQNYKVFKGYNGKEALEIFDKENIHLIIMDIMMPVLDGSCATMKIREKSTVPIIMLSAKSEDMDKILGLNIGADDYVTKPFNPLELIARVNSNIRRYMSYSSGVKKKDNVITIGSIELNDDSKEVSIDGEAIKTTPLEYKIIHLLMSNPNKVFSIQEIYEKVWEEPAYNADTVTVHIRRIREKIEIDTKNPKYLKVVWGIGYKFEKQ